MNTVYVATSELIVPINQQTIPENASFSHAPSPLWTCHKLGLTGFLSIFSVPEM